MSKAGFGYTLKKIMVTSSFLLIVIFIMTKGIVALLIRVLSGQNANDIAQADLDFINKIGLKEQLFCYKSEWTVIND